MSETELPRKDEVPEEAIVSEVAPAEEKPATAEKPVKVKKVGFVPVVLGGVVAAGLGYGAAFMGYGTEYSPLAAKVAATEAESLRRSEALSGEVSGKLAALQESLPAAPDFSPLEGRLAALEAALAEAQNGTETALAPLSQQIKALGDRIAALELAPSGDGTLSDAALAAWQKQMDDLRAEVATQQARVTELASEAATRLEEAKSTLSGLQESASAAAQSDLASATLTRIEAALSTGDGFGEALLNLQSQGIEAPQALSGLAASGAATLAALQDSFPAAARAGLSAERAADTTGGFVNFLSNQFNLRSVAPREGEDADAVLSRAQAAVTAGDLSGALALVETLPEASKTAMAEWIASAKGRLEAETALQGLKDTAEGAAE